MRTLIISQPKSGSYLCANLLQEFGLKFDGYHFSEDYYQKYDLSNTRHALTNKEDYTFQQHISQSIGHVQNNYFAITHLNYTDENYALFRPFKKIIITRSKDEILQSWERFRSIRNGKGEIDITSLNQYHWIDYPNTFHLTFNNMINKDVPIIDNLQQFLFGNILHNSRTCIRTALSASSLTKSNIR